MNVEDLKRIAEEHQHCNTELDEDIHHLAHTAMQWLELVDTEADKLTFGEYTRRFQRAEAELKELMK